MDFNSTTSIKDAIYLDWFKQKQERAKQELKEKKQKEKEAEEKKKKVRNPKFSCSLQIFCRGQSQLSNVFCQF